MRANALPMSPPHRGARPRPGPSAVLGVLCLSLLLPPASAADLAYIVEGIEVEGASAVQGFLGALHLEGSISAPALEIAAPSGFRVDRDYQNNTADALRGFD